MHIINKQSKLANALFINSNLQAYYSFKISLAQLLKSIKLENFRFYTLTKFQITKVLTDEINQLIYKIDTHL